MSDVVKKMPYAEIPVGAIYYFNGFKLQKIEERKPGGRNAYTCISQQYIRIEIYPETLVEVVECKTPLQL